MNAKEAVIKEIMDAFAGNAYSGDDYLQGSFEGCKPYEEIAVFKGRTDWKDIDSELLTPIGRQPSPI